MKIPGFPAKAHPVFHWCLYNKGIYTTLSLTNVSVHLRMTRLKGFIRYSRTPLFRTRLIRSPRYFEGRSNSLGFTLMFSVIYYQLFRTRLFRIPRYFELIVLSLHLKSIPLFRTCQKQSMYIRAQLETYCASLTCSVPLRISSCVIQLQSKTHS